MTAGSWVWFGLLSAICVIWLIRHRLLGSAKRDLSPLHSGLYTGDGDAGLPMLTMLVAAKDEERNIGKCLRSLLAQDYPDLKLVAVNDRSSDETGSIIDELAASDARLTAVHVETLRPGWFGKNNAMREGVERAASEWLCFTDADCAFISPRTLRIAVRHAIEQGVDFLSVLPTLETRSFWEQVTQPACGGIMMIWFNPMKVNNPSHRAAYANGAFMLMRRSCYDAIGGHEPVKAELNEDIHMARRAKDAGQRLRVVSNEDLYTVRMYDSFKQIWAGWTRIFLGCFGTYRRLLLSAVLISVMTFVPWAVFLAHMTKSAWTGGGIASMSPVGWVAAAACMAQLSVMIRFYAVSRVPALYGLLYPLGGLIGLGALLNATRRLAQRGGTNWRGTVYRGTQVEPGGASKPGG